MINLTDEQLIRYSRHILLPQLQLEGQQALLQSRVALVGLGGLGSAVALYLAAAGVGFLRLIDDDAVEPSNLQRQIVHGEAQIGKSKVASAAQQLLALNRSIEVDAVQVRCNADSVTPLLSDVDLIVDCSDNFSVRFLLNHETFQLKKPLVSAAAIRWEGQISVFDHRFADSPCYRCLYHDVEEQALSCSDSGVIAPLVGVMGSMQALEAVKLLTGSGVPLQGKLLLFDALSGEWRTLILPKDPSCPVCSAPA